MPEPLTTMWFYPLAGRPLLRRRWIRESDACIRSDFNVAYSAES
jgi:hypothetical protein